MMSRTLLKASRLKDTFLNITNWDDEQKLKYLQVGDIIRIHITEFGSKKYKDTATITKVYVSILNRYVEAIPSNTQIVPKQIIYMKEFILLRLNEITGVERR